MSQEVTAPQPPREVAQQEPPRTIGALVQSMRGELSRALPKHMDADRMARITLTEIRKNPALAQCTPQSFMGALLTCAQLGLEPGGASGEAYLVPFNHRRGPLAGQVECQLIVGYKGLTKLFWQHPSAKHLDSRVVYERDEFEYWYGLHPDLKHTPAKGDRGDVVAYYATASLANGGEAFLVLSPEEVRELRRGKVGSSGDIADPQRWMERKVVLSQLLKTLPKSTNLTRALLADEGIRTDLSEEAIDDPVRLPMLTAGEES